MFLFCCIWSCRNSEFGSGSFDDEGDGTDIRVLISRRVKSIQEMLTRHVDDIDEEQFEFLVETLKIPPVWIYTAQVSSSAVAVSLAFADIPPSRLLERDTTETSLRNTRYSSPL